MDEGRAAGMPGPSDPRVTDGGEPAGDVGDVGGIPIAVDIDGTLTDADDAIDPRVFDALRTWDGPVVIATGKAYPYPIALCHFMRIEELVIAENGGVVSGRGKLTMLGDREAPRAVLERAAEAGYDVAWNEPEVVNRWRETEIAVPRTIPLDVLEAIAAEYGMAVVDSGYAYHVKSPDVDKGRGLREMAPRLDREPASFVAIGDSQNDIELFEAAGRSFAVANAHERLIEVADGVATAGYADGTLEILDRVRAGE